MIDGMQLNKGDLDVRLGFKELSVQKEQRKVVPYLDTSFNQPSSNTSLESSKGTSNMNSETSSHERQ